MPSEGGGVGFAEKCRLSEVAEVEGSVVLENIKVVEVLVLKNDRVSYMNIGASPRRNSINYYCCRTRRLNVKE